MTRLGLGAMMAVATAACEGEDLEPGPPTGAGVFTTTAGQAEIEGELFLPSGEGRFPVLIAVAGSSDEPRSEARELADVFLGLGVAVYVYDKRGIGGSTGTYPSFSDPTRFLEARADDVLGIVELLGRHEDIDATQIGLVAASQGTWVSSIVHERFPDLAFMIMLSGGFAPTGLEGFYCRLTDDPTVSIEDALAQLESFDGPLGFDPRPIVQAMTLPVLWLYGNEDRSHPARYDVAELIALSRDNFTVSIFDDTNHNLIDESTQEPPAGLLPLVAAWLEQNLD